MNSTALGAKKENINFISEAHEKFYYEKIQKVREADVYHKALCYCLGMNEDTRRNVDKIYNFKTGCVKPECLHEGWQTSGSAKVVAIKTSKLTASVLQKAMKMYLEHQKHKEPSYGKIPVKKLVGQGEGAKSIEVTDSNIKSFERVARKYNVDFAVKKDKTTEPPRYLVFFKGKDADVIAQAFKEFVKVNEKKQQRPSLRQKLKGLQKMIAQNKNRERSREKNKDRGQSL